MKKFFSLLLVILIAFSLTACKGNNADEPAAESLPPIEDSDAPQTGKPVVNTEIVLKNLVLADNDVCTFRINSVDPDGASGYTLEVFLENKSATPLNFSIEDASLNGYMCSPYWSTQLGAEESVVTQIFWYDYDLSFNNITAVRAIEFLLRASEVEDAQDAFADTFAVFPYGDTVEALATQERQPAQGETVLVNNEDFCFSITEFGAESAFAYAINVYLENKTDKNVLFTLDTASLNGYSCNPYWASKIPMGKRANAFVSWMDSDLNRYGITSVNEIEFNLRVYDADDWASPPLFNQTFTVTP